MAVESKPLFHLEVMRQRVRAFNLPEHVAAWQPKRIDDLSAQIEQEGSDMELSQLGASGWQL